SPTGTRVYATQLCPPDPKARRALAVVDAGRAVGPRRIRLVLRAIRHERSIGGRPKGGGRQRRASTPPRAGHLGARQRPLPHGCRGNGRAGPTAPGNDQLARPLRPPLTERPVGPALRLRSGNGSLRAARPLARAGRET